MDMEEAKKKELENLRKLFLETAEECLREGNREGALDMYLNALYVQVQLGTFAAENWGKLAEIYTGLGYLRLQEQRYDLCEEDFLQARTYYVLQQKHDQAAYDEKLLAACYRNLATLYYRWEKYDKMREMAKMALPMYEKLAETDPDEYEEDVVSMRLLCTLQ